nr:chromate transporter [Paenibacillus lycopersici]
MSTLAGLRAAGMTGAVISCIAAIAPSFVILIIISAFYHAFASNSLISAVLQGMQAGVAALMVDYVVDMCRMAVKEQSLLLTLMIPAAFAANFFFGVNVAIILVVCCVICMAKVWRNGRRQR